MDYVHQIGASCAADRVLREDEFRPGRRAGRRRRRRHAKQREMKAEDWQEDAAQTLGTHLDVKGDELLVWLNCWIYPVQGFCPLPRSGGDWQVGIASAGPVGFGAEPGLVALPARASSCSAPTDEFKQFLGRDPP